MTSNVMEVLREHGIKPSAHRMAIAQYILHTHDHPSADRVWASVKRKFPMMSRATVYNTLNLFVEKGVIRELHLSPDSVVFDPKLEPHHHLIDDETGEIHDIAWADVQVCNIKKLGGFEINHYQVVMHGRRRRAPRS